MYVCMYVYVYVYIYMYMYIYICIYIYINDEEGQVSGLQLVLVLEKPDFSDNHKGLQPGA